MFSFKKAFRFLGGAALLLTCGLATPTAATAFNTPPRIWMPLQEADWQPGMQQPLADGKIDPAEYANGIKIDLNDFSNTAPKGNGRLFLSMTENEVFSPDVCLRPDGTICTSSTLSIGFQVHSLTEPLGGESGVVTVYLDAERQKTLDQQSCVDLNTNQPTTRPSPKDRKIQIFYHSAEGQATPTLTFQEYQGNCQNWVEINKPWPTAALWKFDMAAQEVTGPNNETGFVTFEISIHAQPHSEPLLSSEIADSRLFGLGVLHSGVTSSVYGSFGHFPSLFNKRPHELDTSSLATMDMGEPQGIDLSMTAYNVGLLDDPAPDGGFGEIEDFARLTYKHDVICMVELMGEEKREEMIDAINILREANGLESMHAVLPPNGDAPNNVILAAGPILDAGWVRYADRPEVSAECGEEFDGWLTKGGECVGDGPGYKGIVWARIGIKKSDAGPRGVKPATWFSEHFVDVFCTHTQADYVADGDFANPQWCNDTVWSGAVGKHCAKSAAGPMGDPWQANLREEQWLALKNWSNEKRAGGNGLPNGLDRPAFVLGDLNQIGPKAVFFGFANEDVKNWMDGTSGDKGFGTEYLAMRQMLGTWPLSGFDQVNGWAWDLYDLLARHENGTWIGDGTESAVTETRATECITPDQLTGYNTFTELPNEARLDYILVLPAQESFPFYAMTGPKGNLAEPVLSISANAGTWAQGIGCASDHAQISARFKLVQTSITGNYNPNKLHKVTYRVHHLFDINDADHGGDEETDWYVATDQFEIALFDSFGAMIKSKTRSYPEPVVGRHANPKWHDSYEAANLEKVRMGLWIMDSDSPANDDLYDGTSFSSGFTGPHFEFDHVYPGTFRLVGDFKTVGGKFLCTADPSTLDPDGSCTQGNLMFITKGDGEGTDPDEDVEVTQSIHIEEIN